MKKFLLSLLLICGSVLADTTANLITNNPAQWSGIGGYSQLNGQQPTAIWGCCTSYSGAAPFFDTSTGSPNGQSGQFHWSYGQATVQQIIAINQALAGVGAGVQISGYNWGYEVRNMNGGGGQGGVDSLTATTFMTNSLGTRILSDTRVYNTTQDWNWHGGTVNAASPIDLANAGNLGVEFTSMDSGFWAGYYGPQVRNVDLSLNYTAAPVDPCVTNPQSSPSCPGYKTYYNMWDDGYAQVNLPFAFPFYGQLFTTSFMYTNGVVGFLNNNWGFCCDGTNMNGQIGNANSPWNYAIYALNTDLIPGPNSEFYTQVTDNGTGLKYSWVNVPEIGTNLNNTFHVQIKDSGYVGIKYDQVNLNFWRNPLIGIAGDISQGQYQQTYYGPASGLPALAGVTNVYTGTETTDICNLNPLANPSCPGYAQAYHDQQCSINPLYATTCSGYQAAYYTQQCSANPLYDFGCPGYQQAYFDQQCSLNPLYNSSCPGYTQAYFDQQCSLNGLYSRDCPNYAEAYAKKNLLSQTDNSTTTMNTTNTTASTTEPTVQVKDDGKVSTEVQVVSDSTVNDVITKKTEVKSETTTQTTQPAQPQTTTQPTQTQTAQQTEKKQEQKKTDTEIAKIEKKSESKDTKTSSKSKEEAKKEATEKAKELANDMSKAATLEAQAANQGVVLGLMNYVPGFSAYQNSIVPDVNAVIMNKQYNKNNVDNRRAIRALSGASDKLHQEMVNEQYR